MNLKLIALLGLTADAGRLDVRRPNRARQLHQKRLENFLRGVGSAKANCGEFNKNSQYQILKEYLIEENGRKAFYSNKADAGNKISQKSLDKITDKEDNEFLTYGNGWCDKNVYRSWNKCAVSGKCYTTCSDGNCYEEVKNSSEEIEVPDGCNEWLLQCAIECSNDSNCAAWSFRNTNVLGNAEYTCNLMSEILCTRSEQDHGDPRTVYHVKNSKIQDLFAEYLVASISSLEAVKFSVESEHIFNVWSSWGYHSCLTKQESGEKCGVGFQKRMRTTIQGSVEVDKRDCTFANNIGEMIECSPDQGEQDTVVGHGWMDWGSWSPCTQSCGSNGFKKRTRRCGTCSNPSEFGLCDSPTDSIYRIDPDQHTFCPISENAEFETCDLARCLPWSNGQKWPNKYVVRNGWMTHQNGDFTGTKSDWEGGCIDFDLNSKGRKVQINSPERAFAECMKQCADEGAECLSITYFPRITAPYWQNFWTGDLNNCYLHKRRCHEDGQLRDGDYIASQPSLDTLSIDQLQSSAPSYYAYKDLCSNTMICDRWGSSKTPFYAAICDSTGLNAFPSQPACNCPWSADAKSGVRAWGNAVGWNYYDVEQKRILSRKKNKDVVQRALFYTEKKYYNGVPDFLNAIPNGILPCHDPCAHNQCSNVAKCVFNPLSPIGYDCLCSWPSKVSPSFNEYAGFAGLSGKGGCIAEDFRNADAVEDNPIMFGGGWNTLKDPGQTKPVKPHPAYYELKATSDPWTFNVNEVTRIPPTSPNSPKGRFYNCIVNLAPNRMMVVAGKSGQFFDTFDDKTMVYQWNQTNGLSDGAWIGLDGEDLGSVPCQGDTDANGAQHGCIRPNEWPDLPHTPVSKCQGQCRNGAVGSGPTSVHWIHEYCNINNQDFYNAQTGEWENKSFQLCEKKIVQSAGGEEILGLEGKWIAVENTEREEQQRAYNRAVIDTVPFYGADNLKSLDADSHYQNKNTKIVNGERHLGYWRWKSGKQFPTNLYSPMHGTISAYQTPERGSLRVLDTGRQYHGMGQPLCGLVGDKILTGSGGIGRLFSLSKSPETVKKEKVWKIEEGSEFPILRRRSDGSQCLAYDQFSIDQSGAKIPTKFRPVDARRQNFGTVVTPEGIWMIGGLLEPAADLPYRARSDVFNIEGCTKRAHLNDVWVFNPKGWSRSQILGEAKSKYENQPAGEILPTIDGYEFSTGLEEKTGLKQNFDNFRLYDNASDGVTLDQAIEEGWECTAIDGKWCRKPFLNRYTKGAESQVMCFEYQDGFESRSLSSATADENDFIPKRPRSCTIEETANDDNDCICYIIQASGQSGPKQTLDGAGFRPEIDYIEIRRADGTYGSERSKYAAEIKEFCPDAETTFPTVDEPIEIDNESPTKDPTKCTTQCGGANEPACNRVWKKTNLRRRWHEAGRIKNGRMGSLSGVLKGELLLWGGECYGDSTVRDFGPDGLVRAISNVMKPRPCRMTTDKSGKRRSGDYIEAFSFVRMNKAGFIFGERRQIDLVGFPTGSASHDESATSQAFSVFNTMH